MKRFKHSNRFKIHFVPVESDPDPEFDGQPELSRSMKLLLKNRVSFGVQTLMSLSNVSSNWANEVLDPKFDLRHLWRSIMYHFATGAKCSEFDFPVWATFAYILPDIADLYEQSEEDVPGILGWDIDYQTPFQDAQFAYMTRIWKYEAQVYLERTRPY